MTVASIQTGLRLPTNREVHVWTASLDLPLSRVDKLEADLGRDEQERAARFHFERDRARYVAGRGLLRHLLGSYLGRSPSELRIVASPHGKPYLAEPDAPRFNLSHSGARMLVAVTEGREVGIDLECLTRARPSDEAVAELFFSPAETRALRALPASERPAAFLRCWTRKEAWVKARGQGLSLPLDQFDVSLAPGEPAALLQVAGRPDQADRWRLSDLSSHVPGHVAAIAVEVEPGARQDRFTVCPWHGLTPDT